MNTKEMLDELQQLPLENKIALSRQRISEWYDYWGGKVCVSFSGGKDSTVLLDLVRSLYPDVPAVFANTGLEYPEIRQFATSFENVDIALPKTNFKDVLINFGYPIPSKEVAECIYYARRRPLVDQTTGEYIHKPGTKAPIEITSRKTLLGQRFDNYTPAKLSMRRAMLLGLYAQGGLHEDVSTGKAKSKFNKEKWLPLARDLPVRISQKCCQHIKKSPLNMYQRKHKVKPYIGNMAEESRLRTQSWIKVGCNAFNGEKIMSQPMAFWTEQDVLQYIDKYQLKYASVYGDIISDENGMLTTTGCNRTGCIFCAFGMHLEKQIGDGRFERLKRTHPQLYDYSISGGQWIDNPDYDPNYDGSPDEWGWIEWNPPRLWAPSAKGLGFGKVFDMANEIMGKELWRY